MINNYNTFIKESLLDKLHGPTEDDILNHLSGLNDSDKIRVIIKNQLDYKYLPEKLVVDGDFGCSWNELTYLPDNLTVNGDLYCSHNKLTCLPENLKVCGNLYCRGNLNKLEIPKSAKIKGRIYND